MKGSMNCCLFDPNWLDQKSSNFDIFSLLIVYSNISYNIIFVFSKKLIKQMYDKCFLQYRASRV